MLNKQYPQAERYFDLGFSLYNERGGIYAASFFMFDGGVVDGLDKNLRADK